MMVVNQISITSIYLLTVHQTRNKNESKLLKREHLQYIKSNVKVTFYCNH